MTDPERLLQVEGGGLSSALLRAGRADGPSEKLLGDTLLAVGVGARSEERRVGKECLP